MQDNYIGDIGDYGKYGLLREVCAAAISMEPCCSETQNIFSLKYSEETK